MLKRWLSCKLFLNFGKFYWLCFLIGSTQVPKSLSSEDRFAFLSWLCCYLAMWSRTIYMTSLSLVELWEGLEITKTKKNTHLMIIVIIT